MKILVTGANGQLGSSIQKIAAEYEQYIFVYTDIKELDLTDFNNTENYINSNKFDIIINCAAYTAVDNAEDDVETAFLLNAEVPKNLASIAEINNILLIHISTDFVFEGNKLQPYLESDKPSPLSIYGKSKNLGEQNIISNTKNSIIIRTSWLFSEYGNNFVKTILNKAKQGAELKVVDDQIGCPTYTTDLARFILDNLITNTIKERTDIVHFCNSGTGSWYDFAKKIINLSNLETSVKPCSSSEFPVKAKRPAYSVLSLEKIKTQFHITPRNWKESLRECLNLL